MRLTRWCDARPWRHWLVLAAPLLLYFSLARIAGLSTSLHIFASGAKDVAALSISVLALGLAEDAALVFMVLVLLSGVDALVGPRAVWMGDAKPLTVARRLLRFVLHASLLLLAVAPFAADVLLLRLRGMRFTFQYLDLYLREIQFQSGFAVDPHEVTVALSHLVITSLVVLLVLVVDLVTLDLSQWHLAALFLPKSSSSETDKLPKDLEASEETRSTESSPESEPEPASKPTPSTSKLEAIRLSIDKTDPTASLPPRPLSSTLLSRAFSIAVPVLLLSLVFTLLLYVTHSVPAALSSSALNNSLNELFRLATGLQFLKPLGDGHIASAAMYLDAATETYELFQSDVLYRKTTGFQGPLAFDVHVDPADPPNVVLVVVESFRYLDSLYIVGNQSKQLLERQGNVTLTPQFDKWASRGVAFRNMWSSWQTSRSVESILYGQVPYDAATRTGTTTGNADVKLAGMPQLFKQKGYETTFTSGSHINYDQWDKFVPAHGFDEVLEQKEFMELAEKTKGIRPRDWRAAAFGGQERKFGWGVHDDLSFEILGDVLVEKLANQRNRTRQGKAKTPVFLTHYTISSHTPFDSTPKWFDSEKLPDFSAMYKGKPHAWDIQQYAKLRFFTDLALGKFLDRMDTEGVLNDTIVVVVGDHGQGPEKGLSAPDADQIATTRVAAMMLAQGRLSKHAGLVLNEATEHYDLLNTLADIVGVPDGGFLQSSVGRSLKRAAASTEQRPVWTNNPLRQLALVQGHQRLSFDRVLPTMELHDAEADPDETHDLFDGLTAEQQGEFKRLSDAGRRLSRYFKVRWDNKCITQVEC